MQVIWMIGKVRLDIFSCLVREQSVVTLSTTEAEFVAAASCACQ